MKKILKPVLTILAAMMAVSCEKDIQGTQEVPKEGDPVELTFTASFSEDTKTILVDGVDVWWMPGDKISVKGAESPFESLSDKSSAITQFKGTVGYASDYFAVYPYEALSSWDPDSGKAFVELPSVQKAVEGTFDNGLNISVAKTGSKDMSFRFKNVLGYVKFTLTQESGSICSVSVSTEGLGEEALCGTVCVDCASEAPSAVISGTGENTVSLIDESAMQPGDYYIALLPGTYSRGLEFIFTDSQGKTAKKTISRDITMSKGKIQNIGVIKELDFSDEQPDNPAEGNYDVVDVPAAGALKESITAEELRSLEMIRLTGLLNDDDIAYFTQNASSVICLDLSSVSIDNNATKSTEDNTLDGGFNSLNSLKEVYMPVNLKVIEGNAFSQCESLEKVHWGTDSQLEVIGMGLSQDLWYNVTLEGPFSYCTALKSIDIPKNVMTIKTSAFYGSAIEKVNFAEDAVIDILEPTEYYVTNSLGGIQPVTGGMFQGCNNLETIDIPESVLMISDFAFKGSGIKRLEIPETVKFISAEGLFYGCSNLEYVSVPSALKTIPAQMFYGCSNLTDFDFAGGYTSIGKNAFYGCSSLKTINLEGVKEIGNSAFYNTGLVSVKIPDGMTEIPHRLFEGCTYLKEIDFNQAEVLGNRAFAYCALESVTLADPIKEDNGAFELCESLKEIVITTQNIKFDYDFTIPAIEKIVIGKDVLSVTSTYYQVLPSDFNNFVFEEGSRLEEFGLCSGLNITTIELPESVRRLSDYAFENCKNLTDIDDLLKGIEEIGDFAFAGSGVRSVNFPEGLLIIGESAFSGCEELRSFSMPSTLTNIGSRAFSDCKRLMTSTLNGSDLTINGNIFASSPFISSITIGKDVQAFNCSALDENITELIFEEGSQCAKISGNMFNSNSSIASIVLPPSLKEIGDYVFRKSILPSLDLPESLEKIGDYTFYEYKANDNLIIPANVSYIGEKAFYKASGAKLTLNCRRTNDMKTSPLYESEYKAIELGPEVEYVGFRLTADEIHCKGAVPPAFGQYGEVDADVIYVPNDHYKEYYRSWNQYADLLICEDGTVPEITEEDLGIDTAADNVIRYRTADNKRLDLKAFNNGAGGADVVSHISFNDYYIIEFDGPVTTIPNSCFSQTKITEMTLPESLCTIDYSAFRVTSSLNYIEIPKNVTSIGSNAFEHSGVKAGKMVLNCSVGDSYSSPFTGLGFGVVELGNDVEYIGTSLGADEIHSLRENPPALGKYGDISAEVIRVPRDSYALYYRDWNQYADLLVCDDGTVPVISQDDLNLGINENGDNVIYYDTYDGEKVSFSSLDDFGADIRYHLCLNGSYIIVFDNQVTTIPSWGFGNEKLTEITLPSQLQRIDRNAFDSNKYLQTLQIPASVTYVDCHAFENNLQMTVYFKGTLPPEFEAHTFYMEEEIAGFVVPKDGLLAYREAMLRYAYMIVSEDGTEPEIDDDRAFYFTARYNDYRGIKAEMNELLDDEFGANLLCFTYAKGRYVMIFDNDITVIPTAFGLDFPIDYSDIIIPATVVTVYNDGLVTTNDETVIYVKPTSPPTMKFERYDGAFKAIQTIYVPSQSVEAYKTAAGWSLYADRIVGYDY